MAEAGGGCEEGRTTLVPLAAAGAVLFSLGAVAAPLLEAAGWPGAPLLRAAYRPVCHQVPERCLELRGLPIAVCARCLGLYLGGALALALRSLPLARRVTPPRPVWLLAGLAPMAIDLMARVLGAPGLASLPRLAVALPGGFAAGLFLAHALDDLGGIRWTMRRPISCGRP